MSTHLKVFALLAILIAGMSGVPAFGQEGPIAVTTDKESYVNGETIVISGEVRDLLSGYQVSLQVFEPRFGNQVLLQQFSVGPDKTFTTEMTSGGPLWKASGTYTVKVQYGGESRTAESTFEFSSSGVAPPKPTGPSISVDRTNFSLSYSITGGELVQVNPDDNANSLILTIKTTRMKMTLQPTTRLPPIIFSCCRRFLNPFAKPEQPGCI